MTSFLAGENLTADDLNLRPFLHVYQANGATQSIANATETAITFTLEIADTLSGHSTTLSTSRYLPTVPGLFECIGLVAFENNCAGKFVAEFRKNGVPDVGGKYNTEVADTTAFGNNSCLSVGTIRCNGVTDYIELYTITNFGGTKSTTMNTTDNGSFMIIRWVAP